MPRGFQGVRKTSDDIEARRGSGGSSALWFRLKDGDETVIRFLEQDDDIFWCNTHEVPVEGRAYGRDVVCCDQDKSGGPCPGCERGLPSKFKGFINVIWHDAPVFKRDNNRMVKDRLGDPIVVGYKPQVAVWGSGIRLFEQLDEVNTDFRGLMSRRFRVKRKGEKLSTKYTISPEEVDSGPQEFTPEETKLAQEKYDLNIFIKPPTYEEFLKELGEGGGQQNGHQHGGGQQQRVNPFFRNKD